MSNLHHFVRCSAVAVLFALLAAGCSSGDKLMPSDLTVPQLEAKMAKAMDPDGRYTSSTGSIIRQEIKIPKFLEESEEQMVETKIAKPDKVLISTYENNELLHTIGFDGRNGWRADHKKRRVDILDGKQLMQVLNMSKLANMTDSYASIFDKVEIFRCTNGDGSFYLLKCRNTEGSEFNIYIDAATFFVRYLRGKIKVGSATVDYTSEIIAYDRHQGVLLPQKTVTRQNGQKQEVKIIDYKLNVKFNSEDFLPPVF